jgi:lincosamide nucleotidyltransferase A/C/D/E
VTVSLARPLRRAECVLERRDSNTLTIFSLHYGSIGCGVVLPAEALRGRGVIDGLSVACESPEWVLRWRTGYPLRPVDHHDVHRLCERFRLEIPEQYR